MVLLAHFLCQRFFSFLQCTRSQPIFCRFVVRSFGSEEGGNFFFGLMRIFYFFPISAMSKNLFSVILVRFTTRVALMRVLKGVDSFVYTVFDIFFFFFFFFFAIRESNRRYFRRFARCARKVFLKTALSVTKKTERFDYFVLFWCGGLCFVRLFSTAQVVTFERNYRETRRGCSY